MGIKSLNDFMRKKCPDVYVDVHISQFRNKKIAIDTSLYMYHYKALAGDNWLNSFLRMILCMRENNVHPIFIYDNGCPKEKLREREKRRESKEKEQERIINIELALEKYEMYNTVDQILIDFQNKRRIKPVGFLSSNNTINIPEIQNALDKMKSRMFEVTQEDFDKTKELFDSFNIPYMDAYVEAETMCSDLCKQGKVDAVLSEDTDILAYGCPVFLSKFNAYSGECVSIKIDDVLEQLELTYEQFLDFCIMCGTDYNDNIKGIGPMNSYRLIQEHKNIDNLGDENKSGKDKKNICELNHIRVRELFLDYKRYDGDIPYCDMINYDDIQKFMIKNNFYIDTDNVRQMYINKIVFEE